MIQRRIAGLSVEIAPPEKPKFRAPLILVHGLWSGSWSLHSWATDLSNLGWECWAINFRGRAPDRDENALRRLTFEDCLEDLRRLITDAPFPPVLVGHDLGGLVAQKVAEGEKISALVLVATIPPKGIEDVLPEPLRLLRLKYWPLIFLARPFLPQTKDLRRIWLSLLPEDRHEKVYRSAVADSTHLVKEFFTRRVSAAPGAIRCPVLVVAAAEDKVVSEGSLRELARSLGADFKKYLGQGHWIIGETGGAGVVRDIHRWLVQKLGETILLAEFPPR